jgi:hypothetical protein
MKKKHAKALRKLAIGMTVGKSNEETRKRYKQLKKVHQSLPKDDRIK